ncbi:hypothetical protein ANAPC1_00122 [Anaplasma phagocytophilum]|uniref:Uncharacterized protein n=1 Tax=Anaplasma phagocytophilum TaxID=948 RepID=A0AA45ZH16_ANAPH|nr:hypothetical protein [Anaplasma phagocytophilum]SBO13784.1 hypothetical protein ANAPC1_00122 [Anaplasma phagocytophilum]
MQECSDVIKLTLDPSGKVTTATISDTNPYDNDPLYRALADSALRAGLSIEGYQQLM